MGNLIKTFLHFLPVKKRAFIFLRRIYTPTEKIYRHRYYKGSFQVNVEPEKLKLMHYGFQLENEIFWRGIYTGWEKNSLKLWVQLCRTSQTILDIGANTGIYSLIAKAVSPRSEVYAFEPVSRVFQKLKHNNRINSFSINCIEKAVSDYSGKAVLFDTPTEHVYSATVNRDGSRSCGPVREVEVETVKLDDFIEQNNIDNIDLIKIDVERHEPEVLNGFQKYLGKMKPSMIIEVLDDEIADKVESLLKGLDYIFFNIDVAIGLQRVSQMKASTSYNYFICQKAVAEKLNI